MFKVTHQGIFIFFIVAIVALLYLLSSVLTPFLFGALLAYLANPAVKRLEKHRIPHLPSVIIVFVLLIVVIALFISMLVPLVEKQIAMLTDITPQIATWVTEKLTPWLNGYVDFDALKTSLSSNLSKSGWVVGAVVQSSYTVVNWAINLVLIPVVTFYLLRDWDLVLNKIKNFIPKENRATWVRLAKSCDEVLSAFFRGQLMVMLALGLIYGIGLTLIGLKVGFIIGMVGGLLSIVPYLGSLFVLLISSITALVQFGDISALLWVLSVFLVGQALEGYVLTPYFVGNRIGLHPVVVIFAIMAGGVLFGMVGILLALPATAVIKVLLGHVRKRYMPA